MDEFEPWEDWEPTPEEIEARRQRELAEAEAKEESEHNWQRCKNTLLVWAVILGLLLACIYANRGHDF